jgi:transposase InsO family protein
VVEFLSEVREQFPFAIQKIQTDNDSPFGPQFTLHLSNLSIVRRHISPGCPEVNGKGERSDNTDAEEFYRPKHSTIKADLSVLLLAAKLSLRTANIDVLVSCPGDFVNTDSALRVGVGPAERSSRFGISADVPA